MIKRRILILERNKRKESHIEIIYARYSIFFDFTLGFALITKFIESTRNITSNICQSTQNQLTKSGTDPTLTPMPHRHKCGTNEESEQHRYIPKI